MRYGQDYSPRATTAITHLDKRHVEEFSRTIPPTAADARAYPDRRTTVNGIGPQGSSDFFIGKRRTGDQPFAIRSDAVEVQNRIRQYLLAASPVLLHAVNKVGTALRRAEENFAVGPENRAVVARGGGNLPGREPAV